LEKEIIIYKIIDNDSFIGLDEQGSHFFKLFHKNYKNQNLKRLNKFMLAEIVVQNESSTLVFRLRPIMHFGIEKEEVMWFRAFEIIEKEIKMNKKKFNEIWEFIIKIVNNDKRASIFELFCYMLLFKEINIQLNFINCFYCKITYDLYCFVPSLSSLVCKSCFNKMEIKDKEYIANINALKFHDQIYSNINNWYEKINYDNDLLKSIINMYKQVYSYSLG